MKTNERPLTDDCRPLHLAQQNHRRCRRLRHGVFTEVFQRLHCDVRHAVQRFPKQRTRVLRRLQPRLQKMYRHDRQRFHRLQQTVNLRTVHQPLGDLVQHRAVVFVQPEDQIRQQHIGKAAKHIQLVARDQLAVPDLPIGDVMLQRAELMLVFHHGVIIVVRQKHPDKRRMRHQMAVAFKQFVVDAGVI